MHRQEILKLKKSNDMIRSHFHELEKEGEKENQNREVVEIFKDKRDD